MRKAIRTFFIPALLGLFAVAYAQLPPKVIADKYLVQAEQLLEKQDYEAALNLVEKIIVLQKEHSLTLPDEFHFQYAQVTFFKYEQVPVPADSIKVALELVSKYLSAETEGEFYREALALLLKIEEKLEELEFSPDRTCAGKEYGSCWMELTNQPECYVWNPDLQKNDTRAWSGACSGGLAEGEGTFTWNYLWGNSTLIFEETGHLQSGRKHGQWVSRSRGGWVEKITYANGVYHGPRIMRWSDGSTEEGSFVNGKMHGRWINRDSDGTVVRELTYVNGERQ